MNNEIVGSISKFVMEGDNEITYWIDKKYWGKGIATTALQNFPAPPGREVFRFYLELCQKLKFIASEKCLIRHMSSLFTSKE